MYGYVLGDPVNFVDPSGEFGIVAFIFTVVAVAIVVDYVEDLATDYLKVLDKGMETYNKRRKGYKAFSNRDSSKAEKLLDEANENTCKALNKDIPRLANKFTAFPGTFFGGPLPLGYDGGIGFGINNQVNSRIYGKNYPLNIDK